MSKYRAGSVPDDFSRIVPTEPMSEHTDGDFEREELNPDEFLRALYRLSIAAAHYRHPEDDFSLDRDFEPEARYILAAHDALKAELYARQTMLLEGAEPSVIDENAALKRQRNALKAEVGRLRHWKHDRLNQESIEGFFPVQPFGCTERDSCIERSQAKCEWCMNSDTRLAAAEKVAEGGVCPICRKNYRYFRPTGGICDNPWHEDRAEWEQTLKKVGV